MNLRDKIQLGRQSLREGVQTICAPDLFPTPSDVAAEVVDALELFAGCTVLEPSAGTGALAKAISDAEPSAALTLVEVNAGLARGLGVAPCDFLSMPPQPFDRIAMNPPFSGGADIKHVQHAVRFLAPGGVLVAIVADGPRQAEAFSAWEDLRRLPSGTFAGTMVRARIVRLSR